MGTLGDIAIDTLRFIEQGVIDFSKGVDLYFTFTVRDDSERDENDYATWRGYTIQLNVHINADTGNIKIKGCLLEERVAKAISFTIYRLKALPAHKQQHLDWRILLGVNGLINRAERYRKLWLEEKEKQFNIDGAIVTDVKQAIVDNALVGIDSVCYDDLLKISFYTATTHGEIKKAR